MQRRTWKRIALVSSGVLLLGAAVLAAHLWWVMKPHIDAKSRVMERIDLHRSIDKTDAKTITAWLYQQSGVDHVLVNQQTGIAVFTFAPVLNEGNRIAAAFVRDLPYKNAKRYLPSAAEMRGGCPAGY